MAAGLLLQPLEGQELGALRGGRGLRCHRGVLQGRMGGQRGSRGTLRDRNCCRVNVSRGILEG